MTTLVSILLCVATFLVGVYLLAVLVLALWSLRR